MNLNFIRLIKKLFFYFLLFTGIILSTSHLGDNYMGISDEEGIGKKAFCSCGLSSKDPYCDGSHKDTGFSPEIVELKESKKVAWCGCKHSSKGAFCDGSHNKL